MEIKCDYRKNHGGCLNCQRRKMVIESKGERGKCPIIENEILNSLKLDFFKTMSSGKKKNKKILRSIANKLNELGIDLDQLAAEMLYITGDPCLASGEISEMKFKREAEMAMVKIRTIYKEMPKLTLTGENFVNYFVNLLSLMSTVFKYSDKIESSYAMSENILSNLKGHIGGGSLSNLKISNFNYSEICNIVFIFNSCHKASQFDDIKLNLEMIVRLLLLHKYVVD